MRITIEAQNGLTFDLKGRVDVETFRNKKMELAKSIQRDFEFKGFRRGKVPLSIVASRLDEKALEELKGEIVVKGISDFLEERSLQLHHLRELRIGSSLLDGSFEFTARVDALPVLKDIHDYLGVEIEEPEVPPVDDSAIEQKIKKFIEDHPDFEEADASYVAHEGDMAVCSVIIKAKDDGRVLRERKTGQYLVGIDDSPFKDFGRHLLGMKAGETKEVDCKYPDLGGDKTLEHVEASASIFVEKVLRRMAPALTDEYVKKVSKYNSVEEFREAIRQELEEERQRRIREQIEDAVINEIYRKNYFDLPQQAVETFARERAEELGKHIYLTDKEDRPLDLAEVVMKSNEFIARARRDLTRRVILSAVVAKERIVAEPTDVEEYLGNLAKDMRVDLAKLRAMFATNRDFHYSVLANIQSRKAMDMLCRYAVVKRKGTEESDENVRKELGVKVEEMPQDQL